MHGESGGPISLAAHKLADHTITEVADIKVEDNDIDAERYYSIIQMGEIVCKQLSYTCSSSLVYLIYKRFQCAPWILLNKNYLNELGREY